MLHKLLGLIAVSIFLFGCGGPSIDETGNNDPDPVIVDSFEETGELCGLSEQELTAAEDIETVEKYVYQAVRKIQIKDCDGENIETLEEREPEMEGQILLEEVDSLGLGRIGVRTVKNHTLCKMKVLDQKYFGWKLDGTLSLSISVDEQPDKLPVQLGLNKLEISTYSKDCDMDRFLETQCMDLLLEKRTINVVIKVKDAVYPIDSAQRRCDEVD